MFRFAVAAFLLYGGIGKLVDPSPTRAFVAGLIHWRPSAATVYSLALAECGLALWMIVIVSSRPLIVASGVFTAFAVIHVLSLVVPDSPSCGCLGVGSESLSPSEMAGLCTAAAIGCALASIGRSRDRSCGDEVESLPQSEPLP